jgi:primosomal protein N' (replication factor Y) (superfamily II helicase)
VVGVLSADQLLQFPDFRSSERAFQLMVQVAGRAGRKHKRGKVLIQAMNTAHPVLQEVIRNDYAGFYKREIAERRAFNYPPFARLIRITLKHKSAETLNDGARIFTQTLRQKLGDWVVGPAVPFVSRVRGQYLLDYLIKMDRDLRKAEYAKTSIEEATVAMQTAQGFSGIRVTVDVDPG